MRTSKGQIKIFPILLIGALFNTHTVAASSLSEELSLRTLNDLKRGVTSKACAWAKTLRELGLLRISEINANVNRKNLRKAQNWPKYAYASTQLSSYSTLFKLEYDHISEPTDKLIDESIALNEKEKRLHLRRHGRYRLISCAFF